MSEVRKVKRMLKERGYSDKAIKAILKWRREWDLNPCGPTGPQALQHLSQGLRNSPLCHPGNLQIKEIRSVIKD